jgi:hypothetical protein
MTDKRSFVSGGYGNQGSNVLGMMAPDFMKSHDIRQEKFTDAQDFTGAHVLTPL